MFGEVDVRSYCSQHFTPPNSDFISLTFFNKFVANINTSVSGLKLCTAPKYPTRFWRYFAEDMTSRTWKEAQDMSWPNISRYMSFRRAVAFRSVLIYQFLLGFLNNGFE